MRSQRVRANCDHLRLRLVLRTGTLLAPIRRGVVVAQIVREHYETFRAQAAERREGQERLRISPDGQVVLDLRRRWADGTTQLVFDPVGAHAGRIGRRPNRAWAELMERSFGFDVLACPQCAGRMTLVALIRDAAVVGRILRHLGLSDAMPVPACARRRCRRRSTLSPPGPASSDEADPPASGPNATTLRVRVAGGALSDLWVWCLGLGSLRPKRSITLRRGRGGEVRPK